MEFQFFDNVKFEKEKAVRFNSFCRIAKLWQIFEVSVFVALISWSSARLPAVLKVAGGYFVEFSSCLFNHHVVFLIGNAIIVSLFVFRRQNDGVTSFGGGGEFYDDYVKHSRRETDLPPPGIGNSTAAECGGGNEEITAISQCDDVEAAIEKAARQIKRFQRTESEKLKRELAVKPRRELQRAETEIMVSSGELPAALGAAEIETLSNEEFRRTVDAFIDKHWGKTKVRLEWNNNNSDKFVFD